MKIGASSFLILVTLLFSELAFSQSLTEELIKENSEQLVKQARQRGDIVRGAILFHQGNVNCAKCHRPSAERDRIGPDLSRMGKDVSDEAIVESILVPSAKIKEGFESIIATTIDGLTVSGIVVSKTDEQILIRERDDVDRVLTIDLADVEQIRESKTSNMPNDLADQLKNRQQFLDLLRYVLDIRERGPESNQPGNVSNGRRELRPELEGLVLIQKLNCVACHSIESSFIPIAAKQSPRLNWSAKWLNPEYMESIIAFPHVTKVGTTMPDMLRDKHEAVRKDSARAIVNFLVSNAKNEFQTNPKDPEAALRGFDLFHSVGCVACHSPRNKNGSEVVLEETVPLGRLAGKYGIEGLVRFLENPLAVRPSGHMPNMQLTHGEAVDISHFLLQQQTAVTNSWQMEASLVERGRSLFLEHDCIACHTEFLDDDAAFETKLPIEKLNLEDGCLAGTGNSKKDKPCPDFRLQKNDIHEIKTAIRQLPSQLSIKEELEVSLKALNCIACHDRESFGGVPFDRNVHFKTTNLNLGDQGRIPPTLTGVGAKLKPKWMRDVMVNRRSIRPYMKTRMPQYGESNIKKLLKQLQSADENPETEYANFDNQKEVRERGLELAGNKGLNCVACHTYKYKLSDTMPAVDLTEMAERLKKDWFYQYMLEPQRLSPNTVMPSYWPQGKAIRNDIPGTSRDQIEDLWQYLLDGRQARAPRGVVREPLEIVVDSKAKILRRSYPGIGKRGIGVGYPDGVNIAFDAEQLRLGLIWNGKFVDPGGVWTGQGSGNVRPMGAVTEFAKGPDLDDSKTPWIVDDTRPTKHKFKGYWLDNKGRPTFRYTFGEIDVEDYYSEIIGNENLATRLKRRIRFSTDIPTRELRFRIANSEQLEVENEFSFKINENLRATVKSDHTAVIVGENGSKSLQVKFDLTGNHPQELVIEYWWKQ